MEKEPTAIFEGLDALSSSYEPSDTSSLDTPPDSARGRKPKPKQCFALNYQKVSYRPHKAKDRKRLRLWINSHFKDHVEKAIKSDNCPFFFGCCNALVSRTCEKERDHDQNTKIGWKAFAELYRIQTETDFLRYFLQLPPEKRIFPSFNTYHKSMTELKAEVELLTAKNVSLASHIERMKQHIADTLEEKDLIAQNQRRMEEIYLQREKKLHEEIARLKLDLSQSETSTRHSAFKLHASKRPC